MASKKMSAKERARIDAILQALAQAYPDAKPGLDFTNAFELLIATILSAQCTDKQVNKVTPKLFADYPVSYTHLDVYKRQTQHTRPALMKRYG